MDGSDEKMNGTSPPQAKEEPSLSSENGSVISEEEVRPFFEFYYEKELEQFDSEGQEIYRE